jgi:predicted RNase H-like HicB family nuclease
VKAGTLQGILDDAGLSVEQLIDLLLGGPVRRYTVLLTPDPDDGRLAVRVPALPGPHTQGGTYDEALASARDAIAFHLECLEAEGEPILEEGAAPQLALIDV